MPTTRLVPEDLPIAAECGCTRIGSMPETRCDGHLDRNGRCVSHADELRAIEAYKDEQDGCACRELGCENRNDDGDGWDGYCGNCADRKQAKSDADDFLLDEVPFPR